MCAVSFVGNKYQEQFPQQFPWVMPGQSLPYQNGPSQQEFDELKKVVEQMKVELIAAKKQDIEENNPHCEMEEKVALLKRIAELVGVDLQEVFNT
jgi:hypothetical protein